MSETLADMAEEIVQRHEEFVREATIHQRMVAILAELPAIGKAQRNPEQNFMYRGHDDVMNALNPLLARYGVFVVPQVVDRQTSERTTKRGTTMYEVNLHVRYRFYGAKGDYIEASSWGEGTDSGDKSTNKAMTMAFKNVLAQAFAISTAEFSDADAATPEETTRGRSQPAEPPRPFDPGKDVREDAFKGEGFERKIADQLAWIRPDVNWAAVIAQVWEGERTPEFWKRLSNCSAWLYEATGGRDFPPLDDAKIMEGFAWAFNGVLVEVKTKPVEPAADEDPAPLTAEEAEQMDAALAKDEAKFGE